MKGLLSSNGGSPFFFIMAYKDDLENINWQRRRLEIFERDNWTCQCKSCEKLTDKMYVHHYLYFGDLKPWLYPNDMLIILCRNCHQKEQGRTELETNLSTTLKMKGFLVSDLLALSCKLDTNPVFTQTLLKILRDFQN